MIPMSPLGRIALDRASAQSLHQQLYERLRNAVADGRLGPGARLPSTRGLAVQLGVARGTVDAVYARLAGEGYLTTQRHRGTVVTPGLLSTSRARPNPFQATSQAISRRHALEAFAPLQLGLPALDLFPRKAWARVLARQARHLSPDEMVYPDPMGLQALREAVAGYLAVSRGIACAAGEVVITHGYQDALNLTLELVAAAGDKVWIEDPGYGFAQRTLAARRMTLVPVPVDEGGLRVDVGRAKAADARLAVVTPAHQFPMGVTLTPERRRELLTWAQDAGAWLLEDDYDGEFHYSLHKPPALKAMDRAERVFYVGSFSKVMLPSLRLGYLVLPRPLAEEARTAQALRHRGVGLFEQQAVAEFMTQGHFARHLRRMRVRYKARRQALAAALESRFADRIAVEVPAGGMHVLARFPGEADDVDLAARAQALGLRPAPLSGQSLMYDAGRGLLLSFTNVAESKAAEVADRLFEALAL
jgi:GntR family transcriptional regulator/MocR family aminotransferase